MVARESAQMQLLKPAQQRVCWLSEHRSGRAPERGHSIITGLPCNLLTRTDPWGIL